MIPRSILPFPWQSNPLDLLLVEDTAPRNLLYGSQKDGVMPFCFPRISAALPGLHLESTQAILSAIGLKSENGCRNRSIIPPQHRSMDPQHRSMELEVRSCWCLLGPAADGVLGVQLSEQSSTEEGAVDNAPATPLMGAANGATWRQVRFAASNLPDTERCCRFFEPCPASFVWSPIYCNALLQAQHPLGCRFANFIHQEKEIEDSEALVLHNKGRDVGLANKPDDVLTSHTMYTLCLRLIELGKGYSLC